LHFNWFNITGAAVGAPGKTTCWFAYWCLVVGLLFNTATAIAATAAPSAVVTDDHVVVIALRQRILLFLILLGCWEAGLAGVMSWWVPHGKWGRRTDAGQSDKISGSRWAPEQSHSAGGGVMA
jgi:hypothetical protein